MTKTQLNKLTKAELVKETQAALATVKELEQNATKAELIAQCVASEVIELLDDIDLPRKFNFWWIITNFRAIGTFIANVVSCVRDAHESGVITIMKLDKKLI